MTSLARAQADTRGRILETAEQHFRSIGYQKTTVADIAKALRMSPANVYRFFESKKAINEAVAERLTGEIEAALARIAAGPGTVEERLTTLIVTYHRMNAELFLDHFKMHEMVETAICESWEVVQRHVERVRALFSTLIGEGMRTGEFAPGDLATVAGCTHVALVRFAHPQLIAQCAQVPGPTVEQMAAFLVKALKARAAG